MRDKTNSKKKQARASRALQRKNTTINSISTQDPRPAHVTDDQIVSVYGTTESYDTPVSSNLTVGRVIEKLLLYRGHISFTAQALQVTPRMLQKFINSHPSISHAQKDISNSILDIAENKLLEAVQAGDLQAIKFLLKCKGRERGWVEVSESNHTVSVIPVFKYNFSGARIPCGAGQPAITHKEEDVVIDVSPDKT